MIKFKDLVRKNRSYRGYDNTVRQSKEELIELIDHARLMPAAKNSQPLKYFIAYEKEIVDSIQSHTRWAGKLQHLNLPFAGYEPTSFIVILQDMIVESVMTQVDVGIASATITLAAAEVGLGCCIIGAYSVKGVKEVMQLEDSLSPVMVIALGKPAEEIVLVDAVDGNVDYYRDNNNIHYVPKRNLADIIVNN